MNKVESIQGSTGIYLRSRETNLHEIRDIWSAHDILVILLDMDRYHPCTDFLTGAEVDFISTLRSGYFQRRYILSRTLLKIFLREILQKKSVFEISLSRNDQNRIRVNDGDCPWISLSYSQNFMTLFLAKWRATGDVEVVRPCTVNLDKYPAFPGIKGDIFLENQLSWWERWTKVEAYTKFLGIPIFEGLQVVFNGAGIFFRSFLIDDMLMCTVCSAEDESRICVLSWRGDLQQMEFAYDMAKMK